MKMTLDQVIARLQDWRTKVPGETLVAMPDYAPGTVNYIDAVGAAKVGKTNMFKTVSRGGVPVIVLFGQ